MDLSSVSRRLATAGLVALVVVDVVLVGVALRPVQASGVEDITTSAAASSTSLSNPLAKSSPRPSAKVSAARTQKADRVLSARAAPLKTMVVGVDDQRAWRVRTGTCADGGATLDRTADGGKNWVEMETQLSRIVRLLPSAGQEAFVIGAFSGCAALLKVTGDDGDSWGSAGSVADVWFRDPQDARVVGAPGSSTSQPCGTRVVLDLGVVSWTSARVLCDDGVVRQTQDNGSSWTNVGKVTGAVALAVGSPDREETFVARVGAPDCAGVQIVSVGKNADISCVRSAIPKESGQIAMSLVEGGGWLAVGDTTLRSTDDLATWRDS